MKPLGTVEINGEFLLFVLLVLLLSRTDESSLLLLAILFLNEADLSFCMLFEALGFDLTRVCARATMTEGALSWSSLSELVVDVVFLIDEDLTDVFSDSEVDDLEELLDVVFSMYFLPLWGLTDSSGISIQAS